ncbi:MAG TPA: hemerythrin domain-containing protein [Bryobacteraceae bacterium]|nr:hemerythrin domain-containing protein [Bryobacteraceae bacterium]
MVQIGESAATLDQPIEHLMACHRRIEQRLATLERAGWQVAENKHGVMEAIEAAIGFMQTNGAWHTEDEEQSLFPRLRPCLDAGELAFVASLETQHREAEEVFQALRLSVAKLPGSLVDYTRLAGQLRGIYREHILAEDEILTKLAKRSLSKADLTGISAEMRSRREAPCP